MTCFTRRFLLVFSFLALMVLAFGVPSSSYSGGLLDTWNSAFDADKMGDMSDYDPNNPIIPTGDTIKIAVVASHSGPAAANGLFYFNVVQWVAHDINKRGGIMVDGKKKLIQVIKADHMSRVDQARTVVERMILREKVDVLWGTDGSHLMRVINELADRYGVIALNATCLSDSLQDAENYSPYAFHASFSTEQVGLAVGYYFGQIRKKETKFYILNQDYSFGYDLAEGFKKGLAKYHPEATIVGEDYHRLFLTDFAPYLEKVRASGAEIIFTGDWLPDAGNLLKQARAAGINIPFANVYMDEPNFLHEVGVEATEGLINFAFWNTENPHFQDEGHIKFYRAWNDQWKNVWSAPFNTRTFEHFGGNWGNWTGVTYWLFDVMERAGTTDPEKIIDIWKGDTYRFVNGMVAHMRCCDNKMVMNMNATRMAAPEDQKVSFNIEPYYWFEEASFFGPVDIIPYEKCLPWIDPKLAERCERCN